MINRLECHGQMAHVKVISFFVLSALKMVQIFYEILLCSMSQLMYTSNKNFFYFFLEWENVMNMKDKRKY